MGWREWGEGHRRLVMENVLLRNLCLLRLDTIEPCDLTHCDPELHNMQTHRVNSHSRHRMSCEFSGILTLAGVG